ncbi:MAG TPA: hypothetical protein VMG10_02680 [Gemmataceae bacterium]|nr:hypothetical protein [Gemmataceae bacterium]
MRNIVVVAAACFLFAGCGWPKADITAAQLHTAYRDVTKADEQYKGRIIAVSGVVKWAGSTSVQPADERAVYLGSSESGEVLALCQFPPESAGAVGDLRKGQFVVIRGLCRGDIWREGTPYLSKCVLVW